MTYYDKSIPNRDELRLEVVPKMWMLPEDEPLGVLRPEVETPTLPASCETPGGRHASPVPHARP